MPNQKSGNIESVKQLNQLDRESVFASIFKNDKI